MNTINDVADFLTLRSIEWQNIHAFEAGQPLWSDESIRRCYGHATFNKWKNQTICPTHGCIVRDGKCSYEGHTDYHPDEMSAATALTRLPNKAMSGFSAGLAAREAEALDFLNGNGGAA